MWRNGQQHSVSGEASSGNANLVAKHWIEADWEVPEGQQPRGRVEGPGQSWRLSGERLMWRGHCRGQLREI